MNTDKTSAVDIIKAEPKWQKELLQLRDIILSTGLTEEIKWGGPIYTLEGKNIAAIGGFKNYFTIWFHQGVFLTDPLGILINAGEGRTKGLRQWRFHSIDEIKPSRIREYVREAIANAKAGREIKPERKAALPLPLEFEMAIQNNKKLKIAFDQLTPGRQREYLEYIHEAKTETTRLKRVQKIAPMILEGKGLNDRYR